MKTTVIIAPVIGQRKWSDYMITLDEWKKLKVGGEIHRVVKSVSAIHTLTVTCVREGFEKKIQVSGVGCFLDYVFFRRDNYFVNKLNAINHLSNELNAEIDNLDFILEKTKKQLENKKWELNKLVTLKKRF